MIESLLPFFFALWQCNKKFDKSKPECTTPHLNEDDIKQRFLKAYNQTIPNRESLLDDCRRMMDLLTDCREIDSEIEKLLTEAEVITGLIRKCIEENASKAQSQDDFNAKYKSYEDRFEAVRAKVEKLQKVRAERQAKSDSISAFMFELHEADEPITEFDDRLWLAVIDVAIVRHDGMLVFRFRNGLEIEA